MRRRLSATLARRLSPLTWRTPARSARKLFAFALAEQGSMLDMRLAAARTPSPARAALYLRHADDEARHAQMFARHAQRLAGAARRPFQLPPLRADSERLFEALGERDFLAFVHHGEVRARDQFEAYLDYFQHSGRDGEHRLLSAILVDERRHCDYTRELLAELCSDPDEQRRALRRVARWELGRGWLRAGRFLAERVYVLTMLLLYVLAAPLALLVRVARPLRPGLHLATPANSPHSPAPPSSPHSPAPPNSPHSPARD